MDMDPNASRPDDAGEGHVFRYSADAEDQPAIAIVKAVSWVKDVDVRDLTPLHDVIDTEELDTLFSPRSADGEFYRSSGEVTTADQTVSFEYEDCTVTVTDEEIRIDPGRP